MNQKSQVPGIMKLLFESLLKTLAYIRVYKPCCRLRFGRKTAAVFAGTMGAVLGLTKSFAGSFWLYVVLEGLEAAIGDALSPMFMLSKYTHDHIMYIYYLLQETFH